MAPLTADRNTPQSMGDERVGRVAAGQRIFAGAMVMRTAAGLLVAATTALGRVGDGRAEQQVDNRDGADGDQTLRVLRGIFRYANSGGADAITDADIGSVCFAVDDQTVAKTNGGNTRSPAGTIDMIDEMGVWVRFDPALTKAAIS